MAWMTDRETLQKQIGLSLADRVAATQKQFKTIHMNPTLLRKIYRKFGIKKKAFRWYKTDKTHDAATIALELRRMKRQLAKARKDGYRIVYIDETMFTRTTLLAVEWSLPKENVNVDLDKLKEPTLALLHGISKEKGNEHFQIFDNSVNVAKFKEYL